MILSLRELQLSSYRLLRTTSGALVYNNFIAHPGRFVGPFTVCDGKSYVPDIAYEPHLLLRQMMMMADVIVMLVIVMAAAEMVLAV